MSWNRKILVGTIVLVLVIGVFAGTSVIMAHEEDGSSDGEDPGEEEGTWRCHNEDHDDHHDDYYHERGHHHEDGSSSGGFISLIRWLFSRH